MADGECTNITILHVDDDEAFAELVSVYLQRHLDDAHIETFERGKDVLTRLEAGDVDCIVSDFQMPEMDGVELLKAVRARSEVPFILFTGHGSEEVASDAIAAGVSDYVQKTAGGDQWLLLANRVERAVREYRAVAAREESDRRYSTLVQALPGIAYRSQVEPEWPVESVSDGCLELTGYAPEQFESGEIKWGNDVVHPDYRGDGWNEILAAAENGERYDRTYPIITRNGETRWVRDQGFGVAVDGETVAVEGYVFDVTEERTRGAELREKESLLDSLFENAPVHLFAKDEQARHVRVSSALVEDPDSFVGKTDLELRATSSEAHRKQAYEDDLHVLETGDAILDKEEYLSNLDRWNLTSKVPWTDSEGNVLGIIGISRDITERKRRKQEILRQNERLDEFAEIVSHDLRNPLNVAFGNLEIIRDETEHDRIDMVSNSLDRIENIIEDVLSMAREGPGVIDRTQVRLLDAVEESWHAVETADATLRTPDLLGTVHCDRTRLVRLFENLFRNAVEHSSTNNQTQSGDSVEHGSTNNRTAPDDAVEHSATGGGKQSENGAEKTVISVTRLEDDVGFVVTDNGTGIPPAERELVFERGYTTNEDGTGYGLAIVTDIVDAHGWETRIREGADGGARIEIVTGSGLAPEQNSQSNSTNDD